MPDFEPVITSIVELAQAYYYAGQLNAALDIMQHGVAICDRRERPPDALARLLLSQAKLQAVAIFMTNSSPDDALTTVERSRSLTENAMLAARADDLSGLIHYYAQIGRQNADFSAAETSLDKVADRASLLPNEWQCEWVFHRGLIYQNTERGEAARECFRQCWQEARAAGLAEIQSFAVRHLGFIQQYVDKDLSAARASFEESLHLRESIRLNIYLPFSYQTLGAVCLAQGDFAAAGENFERAIASAAEQNNKRAMTLSLLALGDLRRQQGSIDEARKCYIDAKSAASEIGFETALAQIESRLTALSR